MRATIVMLLCGMAGCAQVLALDDYDQPGVAQGAGGQGGEGAGSSQGGGFRFEVPEGWSVVVVSTDGDVLEPCTGVWSDALEGGDAPVADASGCQCVCNRTGGSCPSMANLVLNSGVSCGGTPSPQNSTTSCIPMSMGFFTQSGNGTAPIPTDVVCTATPSGTPTASWSAPLRTCQTSDSCTPSSCPAPPSGYGSEICIMRDGTHNCPIGERREFFALINNNTSCQCDCDSSAIACDATTTLFGTSGCGGAEGTLIHDGTCRSTGTAMTANSMLLAVGMAGDCMSLPPMVDGQPQAAEPHTLCCVPRE